MKMIRIDQYMAEKALTPSRSKAQDLIRSGFVSVREKDRIRPVHAASELIDEERPPEIIIQQNSLDRYVSRGGLKLEGALKSLQISVESLHCLDVGISTGGFTDCLLQKGAASVVGVDVGHQQLSQKLKVDPRLKAFEGINAREVHLNPQVLAARPEQGFDLCVIDVSFISLSLILPSATQLLKDQGSMLALIKPQFELSADELGRGGIVRNQKLYSKVHEKIENCAQTLQVHGVRIFESEIEGKDGNKEFFIYFKRESGSQRL